jgi:hypothetical protein
MAKLCSMWFELGFTYIQDELRTFGTIGSVWDVRE